MKLGQYTRCEIAIVLTMLTNAVCFHTSKMKPVAIAAFNGWSSKSVYRSLRMAEANKLIVRNRNTGEVILTMKAVDAIREAFNGLDGKRWKVARTR